VARWLSNSALIPDRDERLFFSSPQYPDQLLGTLHLVVCLLESVSQDVKHLEHEANPSSPTSVRDKNDWIYNFTPLYIFMACIESTLPLLFTP
jgi:hypothetical protein